MQVAVFDIMSWPTAGKDRTLIPFPARNWDDATGIAAYDSHLKYLQLADDLGFDAVCLAEHHFKSYGICPSPNVMAAVVATHTSHAKIMLLGNCLPLHGHPVRVAEELAMVDVLSGGRLISGFIRGGAAEWFAYSLDMSTVRERYEEAWELIVKCWTEQEPFAWHGKHFNYEEISLMPRPIQKPHPPLVMAASTAESVEWCVRHRVPIAAGYGSTEAVKETFTYYRNLAAEQFAWSPGPEYFQISRQVYVAPTNQKAREDAEPYLLALFDEIASARKDTPKIARYRAAGETPRSHAYQAKAALHTPRDQAGEFTFDRLQRDGYAIVGDPDYVTREMKRQQDALGLGMFMIYLPFSSMPIELANQSLKLFARDVLPNLRD